MSLAELLNLKLVPPALYALIAIQYTTSFAMLCQYKAQGKQELGWEGDDDFSRFLMLLVALWLIFRGTALIFEGQISANAIFLSLSMSAWRINALRKYLAASRRHAQRNIEAVAQAKQILRAKGKLP